MKTIEYATNGLAIGDALCEDYVRSFLQDPKATYIKVSTDCFITAVRCLINEGEFDHKQVQFLFNGEFLQPDTDGRLAYWPADFCSTTELLLSRMLTCRRNK